MKLRFYKYEGAGNDFIVIDGREGSQGAIKSNGLPADELPSELIRAMCDRHRGIGADGVIFVLSDPELDFRMRYYNADGSEPHLCGNGGMCAALFAHHTGLSRTDVYFRGRKNEHHARILSDNGENAIVELEMADFEGYEYSEKSFFFNLGVPHYVEFVKNVDEIDVVSRGREIRYSKRFSASGGTNVNFVEISGHGHIKIRSYERGVENETLACGTGAIASAIATHLYAQQDCDAFTVKAPGGNLDVSFKANNNQYFTDIKLTGPARRIFYGEVYSGNLL